MKTEFSAGFLSGAQRLPNGNTLICEGMKGIVFEVTPRKQVVWQYAYHEPPRPGPGEAGPLADTPGHPPLSIELLIPSLRDSLELSSEQKRRLDELQDELAASLDRTLTAEQKQRFMGRRIRSRRVRGRCRSRPDHAAVDADLAEAHHRSEAVADRVATDGRCGACPTAHGRPEGSTRSGEEQGWSRQTCRGRARAVRERSWPAVLPQSATSRPHPV